MNRDFDSLLDALEGLRRRGYTEDFSLRPHCLACPARQIEINPETFSVDEYYRFEGMSNPDDNSVIYAISADSGLKGILIDAYGPYAEQLSPTMAEKLRVKPTNR